MFIIKWYKYLICVFNQVEDCLANGLFVLFFEFAMQMVFLLLFSELTSFHYAQTRFHGTAQPFFRSRPPPRQVFYTPRHFSVGFLF